MDKPLSILIADDHELVRDGLKLRLENHPGWKVCGEASDGHEAVKMATSLRPDVVVMDISMPGLNGIEATRQIRKVAPQAEILILTMQKSDGLVREALAAGARGFILKGDATQLLIHAVEALAEHRPYLTAQVSTIVLEGYLDPAERQADSEHNRLRPREREILQLLAEARTSKEVAVKLGVSAKTVDAHRANIMRKLNVHSVAELVRYAIRNKIIEA